MTGAVAGLVAGENDSLKTFISSFLQIINIETTLQNLTLIKM